MMLLTEAWKTVVILWKESVGSIGGGVESTKWSDCMRVMT